MVTMRELRDGRTMSYVANILGLSVQAYSNYERGKVKIPATVFIDFCRHFRADPLEVKIPKYVGGAKNV